MQACRKPASVFGLGALVLLALFPQEEARAHVPHADVPPVLSSDAQTVVLSRYTTTAADPPAELAEPLQVVVSLSYPRSTVATVGDAVRHTLVRTGYRLAEAEALLPEVVAFLRLPLPESQRQIGPYRVLSVLDVLGGSAWVWHSDPRKRLVWLSAAESAATSASKGLATEPEAGHVVRSSPVREPQLLVGVPRP